MTKEEAKETAVYLLEDEANSLACFLDGLTGDKHNHRAEVAIQRELRRFREAAAILKGLPVLFLCLSFLCQSGCTTSSPISAVTPAAAATNAAASLASTLNPQPSTELLPPLPPGITSLAVPMAEVSLSAAPFTNANYMDVLTCSNKIPAGAAGVLQFGAGTNVVRFAVLQTNSANHFYRVRAYELP